MEVVEFGHLSEAQRAQLYGDEEDPFEVGGLTLAFQPKERHVGLQDERGRLVASAGLVISEVAVGGTRFPVVGFGGVIVAAADRGRGLGRQVVDAAMARARTLGPEFAMLFCLPDRVGFYRRLGFVEIAGPIQVQQPVGEAAMPLRAMWTTLSDHARWPDGDVALQALPF
jgi:predicted N-acetyltransferase YhbS